LVNLVGNAIKFTHQGSIAVSGKVEERRGGVCQVRIEVADTGIGIPAEARRRLFDPFTQADASTTRRYGGTGLGLAISRQLVQLMGGGIGIESEPGEGSLFWFRVPLQAGVGPAGREEPPPAETALAERVEAHAAPGRRILVVEDNLVNQRLAVRLIERMGHRTEVAANGRDAVAMAAARSYDLILMDCQMPEMDGLEATQIIRAAEPPGRRTPVIAFTASAMQGERERCAGAGMDDFLLKPIRPAEFTSILDHWLAGGRPARETVAETCPSG
jgi:CheY-like chemotaxis protein